MTPSRFAGPLRAGYGLLLAMVSCWLLTEQGRTQEPMPKPLTDQQRERLQERDRLLSEAQKLAQAGKLMEANTAFEKKLAIEREVFGEVHDVVADSLARLARGYEARQNFAAARNALQEVVAIRVQLHGAQHWRVSDARLALQDLGLREKMKPEQRARLGEASWLNQQGVLLWRQGKPGEALPLIQRSLAIRKELLGERHLDCAHSLQNLAGQYRTMGDHPKALPLFEQARDLYKELLGEKHPHHVTCLQNLAGQYQIMGDYPKALPLAQQARDLFKQVLGENHPDHVTSLTRLALLYQAMGDYPKALPLMEQARDLRKQLHGEDHPDYAESLNNLASLYQRMGDLPRTLLLHEQARDLRKKLHGENHPDYANSLNNLAGVYWAMGDYPKALALFEQVRDLHKQLHGENHPDYARSLNNVAMLYQDMGDYPKALLLAQQARGLYKQLLGENNPDYARSLNNLAVLYQEMGDYPKALPLLEQARDLRKQLLGEKHPDFANSLNNLAMLYQAMGDDAKALPLYQRALDLRKSTANVRHPDHATTLANLARLFLVQGNYRQAEDLAHQAMLARQQHLADTFAAQSQRQRLALLNLCGTTLEVYLSIVASSSFPPLRIYEKVLGWKGSLAARQAEDRLAADNPAFRDQLDQLRLVRAELARLIANSPSPAAQPTWLKSFHDLEEQKELLERKLADLSQDFFRLRQRRQASVAQLTQALPQDAALLDFLEYTHWTPDSNRKDRWHTERRLLAFVLRRGGELVLVPLGPVEPIAGAVQAWRLPITAIPPAPPDQKAAEQLGRLLWQPLLPHLSNARTVLIAPDGVLCGLPFAALPGSKPGTFLLEELAIGYLTSGKHLLETADPRLPGEGLLALGGLDFGKPDPARAAEGALLRFPPWSFLVGSQLEVEQVERAWKQSFPNGRRPQRLSGRDIDKARLQRELATSMEGHRWRYLHLATHGFFTPPEPQPKRAMPEQGDRFALEQGRLTYQRNPLLLSGLVLAQANRNPDAGLMTAEEVTALDLRGVELAVLSACETGLGRVADSQGVYGLQRAFQEAGARSLLVSLWSVSDPATSVLMEEFYQQLWSDKPPSKLEALRQAQLKLLRHPELIEARKQELLVVLKERKQAGELALRGPGKVSVLLPQGGKAEAEPNRSHPAYWAPFVLSGDWR
jgi:CHAT domain-containing protein/tetratricopeptide (TPR) repeat protein